MKNSIADFIKKELGEMTDCIYENLEENLENRKNNPFNNFSKEKNIEKYMALGRSFDSQLGNRLQRICVYLARLKYGIDKVPNYIFICADQVNQKINIWTLAIPDKFFDVYSTQYVYRVNNYNECLNFVNNISNKYKQEVKMKLDLNLRKKEDRIKCKKYVDSFIKEMIDKQLKHMEYVCKDNKVFDRIKNISIKGLPIDLCFFYGDSKESTIATFELKAGGNLDTKNCQSNANEVLNLLNLFSFIPNNNSFFATYYNNKGEAEIDEYTETDDVVFRGKRPVGGIFSICKKEISGELKWANLHGRIIVGTKFWEMILPDAVDYEQFTDIYRKQFIASGLEDRLIGDKNE